MLQNETLITFSEAARRLPRFNAKPLAPATIWRWARQGVRGVRLECRLLGGRFVTSIEALDRFSKALAETAPEPRVPKHGTPQPKGRTAKQRERDIAGAEARLDAAGLF